MGNTLVVGSIAYVHYTTLSNCLLRRRIKGAARAFYSHNVRLDVQRLWDIRCFMIFHIVQEVTPETVLGRAQQDWARNKESTRGATASSCLFENP